MANFGRAILGLLSVAGASAMGAYGSARSSFQPQPPAPSMVDLLQWILTLNDPLALVLVMLAAITTGLSIWQAITSLSKKDVADIVNTDGEQTRNRVDEGIALNSAEGQASRHRDSRIEKLLVSQQSPLLPFHLFFTLHYTVSDQDLDRAFNGQSGLRSFDPVASLPPLPVPPGQKGARFILGSGFSYVDFDSEAVRSIGYNIKKIPSFNILHADVSHTFCHCERSDFPDGKIETEPTFSSPTVKLGIKRNLAQHQVDSDYVEVKFHNTEIDLVSAIAIDNDVFVNFVANYPDVSGVMPLDWSIDDLIDCEILLEIDFFYMRFISYFEKAYKAQLHNFHLFPEENSKKCFYNL